MACSSGEKFLILSQILTVDADKVIYVHVTMYNEATSGKDLLEMSKQDMKVKVKTGRANIVYLNLFVQEILVSVHRTRMNLPPV